MAKMFLMCGRLAAGKTYFAKDFAEKNNYRYVSIDERYKAHNGSESNRENKFRIWLEFYELIHYYEVVECDIVVDTNAPTRYDRTEFLNWFPSFEHHLIEVDTNKEQCRINNANRDRVIPSDYLEKINNNFESFSREEYYTYNTRSKWISMSKVYNKENHFVEFHTFLGNFPKYIKGVNF